jgi:hypothetical protein
MTRRAVKVVKTIKKSSKPVASQAKRAMKRGKIKTRTEASELHKKLTKAVATSQKRARRMTVKRK